MTTNNNMTGSYCVSK